jgi:branched-chain amino acid transport system permease protein
MSKKLELIAYAILTLFLFTLPLYLKSQYFITIAIFIFLSCMMTLGLRIIMKVGEVSFGYAAFMGVGAYATALLSTKLHLSFWVTWPIAGLITALFAFLLGSLAVRTKGVHFFLVTLAMGETIRLIAMNWNAPLLGGPQGIYGIPSPSPITFGSLTVTFDSRAAMYFITLVALVMVGLVSWRLDRSRIGRIWDVIGQDDRLAAVIGINVYWHKLISFVLSSTVAGLGGVVFAHVMTYISPYDFTFLYTMQLLVYMIFGGAATFAGPIVGVSILMILSEFLRKLGHYELIFYGFVILLVLIFLPEGVVSWVRGILIRRRQVIIESGRGDESNHGYSGDRKSQ